MKLFLFLFLPFYLFAVDATLKIETDVENRTRIAIMDGSSTNTNYIFKIFFSDLKISGHFLPDREYYKGNSKSHYILPILKSKEYVLKYNLVHTKRTTLIVHLLNASNGEEIFKNNYSISDSAKVPFLIHKAVNDINNILHYPSIAWINRYIIYAVYTTSGKSEIRLADYTFSYTKTMIKGGLFLFPKWADKKQQSIYYSDYDKRYPTLYRLNIYTGKKEKILSSEGMIVCSDVNHNNSKILVTMAPEGQADIYEYNLRTKTKKRVTKFSGIDVNGRYLKGENSIVFVSKRLGYPNIFMKSLRSNRVSKIVYHGRNNSACDAYNNTIIYSSKQTNNTFGRNTFNIYKTSLTGEDTTPLTVTGKNQFPRFSSNGEVVLYLKQKANNTVIGYSNLTTQQSLLFPFAKSKLQSIDW